jgi:hypothetical protein
MTDSARHPVTWEGKIIGEIENLECDNLNFFGKWYPNDSLETTRFYEHLRGGTELVVQIGESIQGIVDGPPGDELEIKAQIRR